MSNDPGPRLMRIGPSGPEPFNSVEEILSKDANTIQELRRQLLESRSITSTLKDHLDHIQGICQNNDLTDYKRIRMIKETFPPGS